MDDHEPSPPPGPSSEPGAAHEPLDLTEIERLQPIANPLLRWLAALGGVLMLALGFLGFFLPGLPGTPLLLVACWLFSMSNARLYRWMLTNRWFGKSLRDYRAGLGIPRWTKVGVVALVTVVCATSAFVYLDGWKRWMVLGLGAIGVAVVLTRPTREVVLARRGL